MYSEKKNIIPYIIVPDIKYFKLLFKIFLTLDQGSSIAEKLANILFLIVIKDEINATYIRTLPNDVSLYFFRIEFYNTKLDDFGDS